MIDQILEHVTWAHISYTGVVLSLVLIINAIVDISVKADEDEDNDRF